MYFIRSDNGSSGKACIWTMHCFLGQDHDFMLRRYPLLYLIQIPLSVPIWRNMCFKSFFWYKIFLFIQPNLKLWVTECYRAGKFLFSIWRLGKNQNSLHIWLQSHCTIPLQNLSNVIQISTCSALGMYPRNRYCEIPCQGDCITTKWTEWSPCFGICSIHNKTVSRKGIQQRLRYIIKEAEKNGRKCPTNLIEKRNCDKPVCYTFSWKAGPFLGKRR